MTTTDNYVSVIVHQDAEGTQSFEWRGPLHGELFISKELLDAEPDIISRLPWKMVFVREEIERNCMVYKREAITA